MKALVNRFLLAFALPIVPLAATRADTSLRPTAPTLAYSIDLNRRADDLFHVTLTVSGLGPENAIYQFASTAPGHLPGHEHRPLRARRSRPSTPRGGACRCEQVSVNQWKLADPAQVRTIRYAITETWDSPLGPPDLQDVRHLARGRPRADQPARGDRLSGRACRPRRSACGSPTPRRGRWERRSTADRDGVYVADSYDQLVDSPILLGRLTRARLDGDRRAGRRSTPIPRPTRSRRPSCSPP